MVNAMAAEETPLDGKLPEAAIGDIEGEGLGRRAGTIIVDGVAVVVVIVDEGCAVLGSMVVADVLLDVGAMVSLDSVMIQLHV
jgi:hypothetical protein